MARAWSSLWRAVVTLTTLASGAIGCNEILGTENAVYAPDGSTPPAEDGPTSPVDAGPTPAARDAPSEPPPHLLLPLLDAAAGEEHLGARPLDARDDERREEGCNLRAAFVE